MANNTGFYRVHRQKYKTQTLKGEKTKYQWVYKVDNELVKKTIKSKRLIILKLKVIEQGLVWGIIDLEKAKESAKKDKSNIKDLQGTYGERLE